MKKAIAWAIRVISLAIQIIGLSGIPQGLRDWAEWLKAFGVIIEQHGGIRTAAVVGSFFALIATLIPWSRIFEARRSRSRLELARAAFAGVIAKFPVNASRKQADGWRDEAATVLKVWLIDKWHDEFKSYCNFAGNKDISGVRRVIDQGRIWLQEKYKSFTENDLRQ